MSTVNKTFSIGQIVYVLSSKNTIVVPVMVVEEVTIQTLNGKKTSWKFAVGSGDKQKIVESKQLDGEIYSSLEEIKTLLINRLTKFIDQTILNASKQEEVWYGQQIKRAKQTGLIPKDDLQKIDPSSFLDDKNITRNKEQNFIPQISKEMNVEEQKKKLREMLTDDETVDQAVSTVSTMIENGVKVKIHLPE